MNDARVPALGTTDSRRRGLVVGIANDRSIAYGCARALHGRGAELAVTYLNEKAAEHVRPLARRLGPALALPLDVEAPGQMRALFEVIEERWGRLDFVVHSIAFAPAADLKGRVVDASLGGFQRAMQVSCYSLIELARFAEPLMPNGGALVAMTFYGGDKVVPDYNLMGPVKAALQSVVAHLAAELGPRQIRVNAVSAGPIDTRAAGGLPNFHALQDAALSRTPQRRLVTIDDVGDAVAFLVSEGARGITGDVLYVDGGRHVIA